MFIPLSWDGQIILKKPLNENKKYLSSEYIIMFQIPKMQTPDNKKKEMEPKVST